MDTDAKRMLENMVFVGEVSSQNVAGGTVKVVRPDKDNKLTAELFVLQRGTHASKDYWLPAVGDQVLCIMLPNFSGRGTCDGFVLGAFYSSVDAPPGGAGTSARVLDHPGDLTLNIGGTLTVNAGTLAVRGGGDVVASGISLAGHVHGGVLPGGAMTAGPQ